MRLGTVPVEAHFVAVERAVSSWSRSMLPRSELINVIDGTGRLQVRGTIWAFGLFVDDQPVAANWDYGAGSIGQCFYRVADCSLEQSAAMARDAVRDASPPDRPLADRFWPLLNQLASGAYRLDYDEAGSGLDFEELKYTSDMATSGRFNEYVNYSPFDRRLLPTQSTDTRDQPCLLDWAVAIESGQRPTVITTMIDGADSEFILDGHHKLDAYKLAGVQLRRLAIVPLTPPPIRSQDWPDGQLLDPPESWHKALALKQRLWSNPDFDYQRRAEIAERLGITAPNLIGFLVASYAYVSDYSCDFSKKDSRGWFTSPAKLELLERQAELGLDGRDIVKVAVIDSQLSSDTGLVGWVPLMATTFVDYFNSKTRKIEFRKIRPI